MRRMKLGVILALSISTTAGAFFNGNNWSSPFGSGTGAHNNNPWGNNSAWNPFAGGQFSPANDARNLSRYGANPESLKRYQQNSAYVPSMPTQVFDTAKPSNWLQETDFSSTLEQIENTGNKMFYVNQPSFASQFQKIQQESQEIDQAVRDYMQRYDNSRAGTYSNEGIYGKQGYALSPAAMSTSKVEQSKP